MACGEQKGCRNRGLYRGAVCAPQVPHFRGARGLPVAWAMREGCSWSIINRCQSEYQYLHDVYPWEDPTCLYHISNSHVNLESMMTMRYETDSALTAYKKSVRENLSSSRPRVRFRDQCSGYSPRCSWFQARPGSQFGRAICPPGKALRFEERVWVFRL